MANLSNSFLSGSSLLIKIDGHTVAYAANLSFTDDVTTIPVGSIGSYSYDALEPTQYAARGSFAVTRYTREALAAIQNLGKASAIRANLSQKQMDPATGDGNSILVARHFNPQNLLLHTTFDIEVYFRGSQLNNDSNTLAYVCKDCRLTSYSIGFTPGSLTSEQAGFICLRVEDQLSLASSGNTNIVTIVE